MARLDETITAGQAGHISDSQILARKANYIYDVKDYGATGDGVTDDTTEIQAAIDAANTAGGGDVFFPPAINYQVSASLTIGDNTVLRGQIASYAGSGTSNIVLVNNSDVDLFVNKDSGAGNSYITIRDLYLNGGTQTTGNAIALNNVDYATLTGLKFNNWPEAAIELTSCGVGWITANFCMNVNLGFYLISSPDNYIGGGNSITTSGGSAGITLSNSSDHNIVEGNFVFLCDIGIFVSASDYNQINTNRSNTNKRNGIQIAASEYTTIVGNRCYDNHSDLGSDRAGLILDATSNHNTVVGNVSTNELTINQIYGIRLDAGATGNTVIGNVTEGNASIGIFNQSAAFNAFHGNTTGNDGARELNFNVATPDVSDGIETLITKNSAPTTVTDFTGGTSGQTVTVIVNDANTTVDFTASGLKGNGGADWSPANGDHMVCTYDGTDWFCIVSDNTA